MVVDGAGESSSAAAVAENVAELQFGPEFEEIHSKYAIISAVGGRGEQDSTRFDEAMRDERRVLLAAARMAFE